MYNYYYHYLSYLDGLSVKVKSTFLNHPDDMERILFRSNYNQILKYLESNGVNDKEASYGAFKISDVELKKLSAKEYKFYDDIKFISFDSPDYPDSLRHIYNPPLGLFLRGELPSPDKFTIAVIGARDCTLYGEKYTKIFTRGFCEKGICIISGLARGIDGIAGRISSEYKGQAYAVLGSGINVCYPESNRDLYNKLYNEGTLISEYPPNVPAKPFRFPYRNRIISGLSEAVFVSEAAEKSGSHITANFALEQGKDVFALPGPLDSKMSVGTNILIKNGAYPALSVEDVLQSLQIF